jgi:hypothetical protein
MRLERMIAGGVRAAVAASLIGLVGCAAERAGEDRPLVTPPGGAMVASPFSPARLRIFPLTHFEAPASGEPRILLFLELRDQWGDTVKGAGRLEVQLFRPEGGAANRETQELIWEIDLADLERNARLYDPSTRTYRVALKDLPPWLAATARGEGSWVALEAFFRTIGPDGSAVTLRDRFVLSGG